MEFDAAKRFDEAAKTLMDALPRTSQGSLKKMKSPELETDQPVERISERLNEFLDSLILNRTNFAKEPRRYNKAKRIVQNLFVASYPFFRALLLASKTAIVFVAPLHVCSDVTESCSRSMLFNIQRPPVSISGKPKDG